MAVDEFRLEKEEKHLGSGNVRAVKAKNLHSFKMDCRQAGKGVSGHYVSMAGTGHSAGGKAPPGLLIQERWGTKDQFSQNTYRMEVTI